MAVRGKSEFSRNHRTVATQRNITSDGIQAANLKAICNRGGATVALNATMVDYLDRKVIAYHLDD